VFFTKTNILHECTLSDHSTLNSTSYIVTTTDKQEDYRGVNTPLFTTQIQFIYCFTKLFKDRSFWQTDKYIRTTCM